MQPIPREWYPEGWETRSPEGELVIHRRVQEVEKQKQPMQIGWSLPDTKCMLSREAP